MLLGIVLRVIVGLLLGLAGWALGLTIGEEVGDPGLFPWGVAAGVAGLVLGLVAAPYLVVSPIRKLNAFPASTAALAVAGLLAGLAAAALLTVSLGRIPGPAGIALPIVVSLGLGGLGTALFVAREAAIFEGLPGLRRFASAGGSSRNLVLLDTSGIIDGRVMDVAATGFLTGPLGVPRFILNELQHIADSPEPLRRNRGRRGLEVLHKLRNETQVPVQIMDADVRNGADVDARLVLLARKMKAAILTTDYNLNRVAELQGVKVLNVNELANALRPVVLPSEDLAIKVIQEGREPGQGVGFLDDGTMVVVEGGKRYINSHLDVAVTRVLQNASGRIIFAQPKAGVR